MAVTWWMPSSFMVRLDLRWTKSSCTSNYIVRGSPAAGARRPPASCGRAVDALDRLLAAGACVAEAVGRHPRRRAALDRRHADQFTLEALLGGGHARVAVVVEVGLVGPRVQAAQERDEVRIGRRVGVVAGRSPASPSPMPMPREVIDPPTNSIATVSPTPRFVRTSPATNVWMSPVTNTTSLMPLDLMKPSSCSRSAG